METTVNMPAYPVHDQPKGKMAHVTWAVPIDLIIQKKKMMKIPIGGKFCFTHLKSRKSTCTGGVPNDDPDNMCKDDDL